MAKLLLLSNKRKDRSKFRMHAFGLYVGYSESINEVKNFSRSYVLRCCSKFLWLSWSTEDETDYSVVVRIEQYAQSVVEGFSFERSSFICQFVDVYLEATEWNRLFHLWPGLDKRSLSHNRFHKNDKWDVQNARNAFDLFVTGICRARALKCNN